LFISHGANLYGAERSLLGLLSSADRNIFQCHVVTPHAGRLTKFVEALGIPVFLRPLTYWVVSTNGTGSHIGTHVLNALVGLRSRVAALCDLIQRHSIDLVYTNTVTCIDGALAARATGRKHVWHLREHASRNPDLTSLLPAWALTRFIARLSTRVIVNSEALRSAYDAVPADRISVVHNGIDLRDFYPDPGRRAHLLKELGLPGETRIVATVGSITPRKGIPLLAEAAAQVRRRHDDVAFLVVGDGPPRYVETVKSVVSDSGLRLHFRFLGWRSDVADILRASDLLVVAASQEAFGRTVIEAMATGVPVVATRCGGPEEILVHGETGFLVPVNDAAAMADAICSVIANRDLATRVGAAGRAAVQKKFSVQAYGQAVLSILREVAAHGFAGEPISRET